MQLEELIQPFLPDNGRPGSVAIEDLHTTFLQTVAHELRTPLCILQGYAELLDGEDLGILTPEQKQATEVIVARVCELRTLVERIGIMLATRALATVSVPLSPADVLTRVVEGRRAATSEAGLTVEMHLEPNVPLITGDPYQLQSALDCLLENALKFTPRGGRIELTAYTEPGWVCLAFTDTGIGMTEEEMEYIFTPFYQADSSTTRQYRGLGLGLALVKAVIEGHGGHVHVTSQPGQGSRFTVKLPGAPRAAEAQRPAMDQAAPRRVLVVDDEENVALTIQDGLERLPNCEVVVATRGEEALQLFEDSPFDLLITDYKMPGTDGMTLSAHVRQQYPHTAIIMITAYGNHLLREQAHDISIRCVLDKPVKLDEIRSVALEALDQCPNA